jgi:hypothetical protein
VEKKMAFKIADIKEAGMALTFGAILLLQVAVPTIKDGIANLNLSTGEAAVAGLATIGILFGLADAAFNAMGTGKKK